jgi:hypothetical protein
MKQLIDINGTKIEVYMYDSMFDYLKDADFSYRRLDAEIGDVFELPFIDMVFPIKEPEFIVDQKESFFMHGTRYSRVYFNDAVEKVIYLAEEALVEPIFLIYDSACNNKFFSEGTVYETYSDACDDIEFDASKMCDEEFDEIFTEVFENENARSLLTIGDVFTLVSEDLNNQILARLDESEWDNNDAFYDALCSLLDDEGKSIILDVEGVLEILYEEFNNEIIDKWEEQQWQRIYDEEPKD